MMNDKEKLIEKNSNEIMETFKESLAQIDEEMTKEFKPEKDSRSEKRRVNKAFMHIGDNDSVAGILGFALLRILGCLPHHSTVEKSPKWERWESRLKAGHKG